jgi:hypothetical protein
MGEVYLKTPRTASNVHGEGRLHWSIEVSTIRVSGWVKEAALIHSLTRMVLTSFLPARRPVLPVIVARLVLKKFSR